VKEKRAVLCDLDDTFYVCKPGEDAGLSAVVAAVSAALDLSSSDVEKAYADARRAVKARIDGRGSSHSRLLYICELAHQLGRPDMLVRARSWERTFWNAYLSAVSLRPRVLPFLTATRRSGRKVALVSDLTLEVQLHKLDRFGLFRHLDAIAISEEVPFDKPAEEIFRLAMDRVGAKPEECVMVGDHDNKDGEGARRLGIPFVRIAPDDVDGAGFDALARDLGVLS
jgi:putative hydrolase of the HAD superfamily